MVFRCFVEKKPGFDGAARALCRELTEQLGVRGLERVRVLNRYDVEGVSKEMDEYFDVGKCGMVLIPPAHPRCRCVVKYVEVKE